MVKKRDNSGLIFLGILFIGIGIGYMYNNIIVGSLFGLGIGFLAMFIAKVIMNKE